jgi:GNAT superfamily N-acetyltransferase
MATYQLTRYPRDLQLRDGTKVLLRPMTTGDTELLLEFFERIPEAERYFMKDNVTSPKVLQTWADNLDYGRALPLLGIVGDRIVADATLIRQRGGYRSHIGELRIAIDPAYRGKGLGVAILEELVDIAWDAELEFAQFELVRDIQDEAISAAEYLGAFTIGTLEAAVKDAEGATHDQVFLRIPLGKWWQWSRF